MTFRKVIFWIHLIAGIAAGIVILIMSVTGVLLTYEKQMIAWADREYLSVASTPGAPRASVETIVSTISKAGGAAPATVTFYANSAVASAAVDGSTYYVNAQSGALLGVGSTRVREFFRSVTTWHRYVAMSGEQRDTGKAITGASNFVFLFIVLSGAFIWWRGRVTLFKRGLSSRALFFNWHNVFGFWALVPLFLIVLSGTIMSYPWASNLVYTLTGSEPPAQNGGRGGGQNRNAGAEARNGARGGGGGNGNRNDNRNANEPAAINLTGVDAALARAEREQAEWRTIAMRLPSARDAAVSFTVDRRTSGQPQFRSTLSVDRTTGEITASEKFADQNLGRRTRSWFRNIHTGEFYGVAGQTVAGLASFAGVMLVGTGFTLSLQRFASWVKRRRRNLVPAAFDAQENL